MALKCADVGHLSKSEAVHKRWVCSLEEELFRQGDMEKKLGLPISPLMNRDEGGITASQVSTESVVSACCGHTLERPGGMPLVPDNLTIVKSMRASEKSALVLSLTLHIE